MKRICAVILCASLMLAALCGCGADGLPAFLQINEPTLVLAGEYPCQYPAIEGVRWGEETSGRLHSLLEPLIYALTEANSGGTVAYADYELTPAEAGCELTVFIRSGQTDGSIRLCTLAIGQDGEVSGTLPELPGYMRDGALLEGCLRMSRWGLTLPEAGQKLTYKEACRVLVDYCEACTGREIDCSRVRLEADDSYLLKAVAAGICTYPPDYSDMFAVYGWQLADMTEAALTYIFTQHLGRSNHVISADGLADAAELFLRLYYSGTDEVLPTLAVSESDLAGLEDAARLTRDDIAGLFYRAYRQLYSAGYEADWYYSQDWSSEDMTAAFMLGLIDYFPSYGLASCDYAPRQYQLFDLVNHYAFSCFTASEAGQLYAYDPLQTDSLIAALGLADGYLDDFAPPAGPVIRVCNTRPYQWYFAQFNTGEYSDSNCMPSITAMAVKWYFPDSAVTVEEIRNLFAPEDTDYGDYGWYMYQVADSLEHYGVPYEWHDIVSDMTVQLDRGRIILTQMTEAAMDASGHCFVIYGYQRVGDSVQFMVHDPGLYDGLDHMGKPPGEAMLLDGEYVRWIVERMTYSYISVG